MKRTEKLRQELLAMEQEDIATRERLVEKKELLSDKYDYHPEMKAVHEKNNKRMKEILAEFNWPGYSLVGKDGCHAAWLIVQHAILDLELQKHALALLKHAAEKNEASKKMVAFLEDRVLMKQGKPQVYGTQHILDKKGNLVPYIIHDPEKVDARRKAVGMQPLADRTKLLNEIRKKELLGKSK